MRIGLLRAQLDVPTLAVQLADELLGGVVVDSLNKWFLEVSESPAGSILLFLLIFLSRLSIDAWTRKRQRDRAEKKKIRRVPHG